MPSDQVFIKKLMCFVVDSETESVLKGINFTQHNVDAQFVIGNVLTAVNYLKENRSPDILIIDISKSKFPTDGLDKLADVCEPGVEVIAIGEKNEVGIYRDLMNAGVHDYFVKPIPAQPLLRCINTLANKDNNQDSANLFHRSGKVVAVVGAVGGIGVSTMAANLSWVLAERKQKRVALVDLDFQLGTIPEFLDIESGASLTQLFDSPERIDDVLIERYMTHISDNFMVLSAQNTLESIEEVKPESVDSVLNILASKFHYVISDLPRNYSNSITLNVLKRADLVLILTDYSITGLKSTNRILEVLNAGAGLNQQVMIVANKVNLYTHGELTRSQFEERLPHPIEIEIHFDKKEPMKSLTDGEPVIAHGSGILAKGLIEIANNMLSNTPIKGNKDQANQGLFSKIFGN